MKLLASALAALALSSMAMGAYTITQGTTAPTYGDYQLDFDQPGDPTGAIVGDEWYGSHGITLGSGVGDGGSVDDWDATYGGNGWLGAGNSHWGSFGTFITFDGPVGEFSLEVWNNGTDPFFGGIGVYVFQQGVEVGFIGGTPAWNGAGMQAWDIVATDGDWFDEVRIIDWDFASFGIYTDNYSWNDVPAPGALALLGLAGLARRRRR